jgi:hypothetical protein
MKRHDDGILQNGFVDPQDVQAMVDSAMDAAMAQLVINQATAEGQTITLPATNQSITLNLLTGGSALTQVNVSLPGNSDGFVGQRVFVNSDGQVAQVSFSAGANQVNNADVMFSPGDNYVYYRNQPTIWSRVTS